MLVALLLDDSHVVHASAGGVKVEALARPFEERK